MEKNKMEKLKRVIIKEELVALTGDFKKAIILNQFLYWSERVKDFDKFLSEEKERYAKEGIEITQELQNGWIYKKAEDLSEETMIGLSKSNMGTHINFLVENGWLDKRNNPNLKWDRTFQYRVNIVKIQYDLQKLGYALEGYPLLVNTTSSKTELAEINEVIPSELASSKTELYNSKTEFDKFRNRTAIPETTTETTTETINTTGATKVAVVAIEQESIILEETNIKTLTAHQKKKVSKWDASTLIKSIAIYNQLGGQYFKLLEKIYLDGAKDSLIKKPIALKSKNPAFTNTYSHNWDLNHLDDLAQEYLEKYVYGDSRAK